MNRKGSRWSVLRYLAYFTQFGITMVTPPLLCAFGAVWLRDKMGWGNWIVIVGIVLGLAIAARGLYDFMKFVERKAKEGSERLRKEQEEVLHDDKTDR